MVIFAAAPGVDLRYPPTSTPRLSAVGGTARLVKLADDIWRAHGDFDPA